MPGPDANASSTLPMQKTMAMTMAKPQVPLMQRLRRMEVGTTTDGLTVSSDIWTSSVLNTQWDERKTHVESSICANKGEGITHHTNHKRHTIRRPTTIINKSTKDIRSTSMRSKSDEWDENSKETKNVKDQNETFKLGKY